MKDARRERGVDARLLEHVGKVLDRSRATRSDQRHLADGADRHQLLEVVAGPHTIRIHAVQDDLAGAAQLDLAHPLENVATGILRAIRAAAEPPGAIPGNRPPAVDSDDDTLRSEAPCKRIDQLRRAQRRGVHRHLLRARGENPLGLADGGDPARDAERDVELARDAPHPLRIGQTPIGARANVIEHELVRPLVAIADRELEDVARDLVVAKANALDYGAVADIEAGEDTAGKYGRSSE